MKRVENKASLFSSFRSENSACKEDEQRSFSREIEILRELVATLADVLAKGKDREASPAKDAYPEYLWLPSSKACEKAEENGIYIDAPWASRNKRHFRHRKPQLDGNHKVEVEYHDFVRAFVNRKRSKSKDDEKEHDRQIAALKMKTRLERSLD